MATTFLKVSTLNSDLESKGIIIFDGGHTVQNIIHITSTVICKLPNMKRIIYCQLNGSHLYAGGSSDYKWLNGELILKSLAREFGCSSVYANEEIIPINQSGLLTDSRIGYGAAVQFRIINGEMFFCLGRYYTTNYDFGLWPMSEINNGIYSFSFLAQIW